jgi:hypothetical protein
MLGDGEIIAIALMDLAAAVVLVDWVIIPMLLDLEILTLKVMVMVEEDIIPYS